MNSLQPITHKGFKTTAGLVGGVVVLIVAVLAFGYWMKARTPIDPNYAISPTSNVDTSTWPTYRNDQYGFEMKLAPSWKYDSLRAVDGVAGTYRIEFAYKTGDVLPFYIIPVQTWDQWMQCQQGPCFPEEIIGAGGIVDEIARNNTYVIAQHSRYSFGYQDDTLFAITDTMTKTLKAFNP